LRRRTDKPALAPNEQQGDDVVDHDTFVLEIDTPQPKPIVRLVLAFLPAVERV